MANWWELGEGTEFTVADGVLSFLSPGFLGYKAVQKATGDFGNDAAAAIDKGYAAQDARDQETADRLKMDRYKDQKANAPFAAAGRDALAQQRALAGLDGEEAQAAAIAELEQSPQFQAYLQQQEGAILANAAATGGLRGGNVQGALAQGRSQLLSDVINQQYSRLGSLVQGGQQATQFGIQAGQANTGMLGSVNANRGANEAGAIIGRQGAQQAGMQQGLDYGIQAAGLGLQAAGVAGKVATGGVL